MWPPPKWFKLDFSCPYCHYLNSVWTITAWFTGNPAQEHSLCQWCGRYVTLYLVVVIEEVVDGQAISPACAVSDS